MNLAVISVKHSNVEKMKYVRSRTVFQAVTVKMVSLLWEINALEVRKLFLETFRLKCVFNLIFLQVKALVYIVVVVFDLRIYFYGDMKCLSYSVFYFSSWLLSDLGRPSLRDL